MKRFTLPCKFGDVEAPFHIYVGAHFDKKKHPLQNQAWWLQSERGGMIPQVVMESFENLAKISIDNNVNFEELCSWSLAQAEEEHEKLKKSEGKPSPTKKKQPAQSKPADTAKKKIDSGSGLRNYTKTTLSSEKNLIAFKNREKNIEFLHGFARHILHQDFALQSLARKTLLATMIYVCDFEFKEGSIEDAYKMLTSDDFLYNTAVILDTTGGIMSKFVTTSLYYYLSSSNQDRTDALTQIFCRLTDFAFDKLPANSPYKTIQHALKKHLVVQEVAA